MRTPWIFYDPILDEEYLMPINPNTDSSEVGISKKIAYSSTAAGYYSDTAETPGSYYGVTIIHENVDEVKKFAFSGIIYTSEEYYQLLHWSNKNNFIQITDDIGRTYEVYIKSFSINRQRSRRFRWKHTYNMEAFVRNPS